MWGKYCRIYPEFAPKKTQQQCFIKGTTNIRKLTDSPRQNDRAENILGNFISILDRRVISISLVSTQVIFSFHDV
jgi:hypothetical protein